MNAAGRFWHGYFPFAFTFLGLVGVPLGILWGGGEAMALSLIGNNLTAQLLPASQAPTAWPGSTGFPAPAAGSAQAARDAAAAAPMPLVNAAARLGAATDSGSSSSSAPMLHLPLSFWDGPDADYPRTPEGAVQALASLDRAAMAAQTPQAAQSLWATAALPGAVPFDDWVVPRTLGAAAAQVSAQPHFTSDPAAAAVLAGDPNAPSVGEVKTPPGWQITFTPTHGQIKAVLDDGDFVVACVLGRWTANSDLGDLRGGTLAQAMGDCERMQWTTGRWRIGAGPAPFPPPVVWPDRALCERVGWKVLTDA